MAATIAPIQAPASSAPVTPAAPQLTLQPGTVISAQVVQLLENGLAQIAIDGIVIAALSEVPLQAGDTLRLAVSQAADGVIKLSIVPQSGGAVASSSAGAVATSGAAATAGPTVSVNAASSPSGITPSSDAAPATLANAEAVAIAVATQAAAPRQQSLAPLFANLPVVVASDAVPPTVQAGASQLLALRPELSQQLSADDLRSAFNQSGLFLESLLAAGAAPDPSSDLKAALVSFRNAVSNWLGANGGETAATAQQASLSPSSGAQLNASSAQSLAVANQAAGAQSAAAPQALLAEASAQVSLSQVSLAPAALEAGLAAALIAPDASAQLAPSSQPTLSPQLADAAATSGQGRPVAGTNLTIAALEAAQQLFDGAAARSSPQGASINPLRALQAILSIAAVARSPSDSDPALLAPTRIPAAALAPGETAQNPSPPFRGAAPSAQPIAAPSLATDSPPHVVGQHLLEQTEGAIARQTLLQVASLPDRVDGAGSQFNANIADANAPRWSFEIPFATPQGTALAQFEIERDGSGGNQVESAGRVWRARFTLNIEPTGPVHALVSLVGEKTAVRMWAERPETATRLRAQSEHLVRALRAAELQPGDVVISGGAPPQAQAKAGQFLDRAS
jgi:hypothetical protein